MPQLWKSSKPGWMGPGHPDLVSGNWPMARRLELDNLEFSSNLSNSIINQTHSK